MRALLFFQRLGVRCGRGDHRFLFLKALDFLFELGVAFLQQLDRPLEFLEAFRIRLRFGDRALKGQRDQAKKAQGDDSSLDGI